MVFMRKQYEAAFKAKVALEAVKGEKTIAQIATEFEVPPTKSANGAGNFWMSFRRCSPTAGRSRRRTGMRLRPSCSGRSANSSTSWSGLKKISDTSIAKKRQEVEPEHPMIPISRQCELVELSRSSFYYRSCGEDGYNLALMRLIEEEYTRHPFYGARRMAAWLRARGHPETRQPIDAADGDYGDPDLHTREWRSFLVCDQSDYRSCLCLG
jgi:putative transposase